MIIPLGTVKDGNIFLHAQCDIKTGEVHGFDFYQLICPVNAICKVEAISDVKKDDKAFFKMLRI